MVICTDGHALAAAARHAFYHHRPLILSPDAVWFCLAQGFAQHVSLNAERMRERLVRFSGKATLVVTRPDFELGRPNPWPEVFSSFSSQIAEHVGKLRDLVMADFSTTGPVERAASEVLLMDTFQPYFDYEVAGGCGIPSVTLLGTPEDWRSVRRRAAMLGELELEHWIDALTPVLDELVATSEGRVDPAFWRSFFRYESASGGGEITGWIQLLFPYLVHHELGPVEPSEAPLPTSYDADGITTPTAAEAAATRARRWKRSLVPNPHMQHWREHLRAAEAREGWPSWGNIHGPSPKEIPASIASAPLRYVHLPDGSERTLRLVAGLLGVSQARPTGALYADFGWAVIHDHDAPVETSHHGPVETSHHGST
ncbi:MAG: DUF4419 domain-containing protein [Polyangiaceae bacterium]